jgi:hypothetical protein
MKKRFSILIAVILLALIFITAYADSIPTSVLEKSKAVYYVEVKTAEGTGSGTAFVIYADAESTYLITNFHVVKDSPDNIAIWISKDQSTHAELAASSLQEDLALLKVSQKLDAPVLKFSTDVHQGDEVFAVGFPAAADALSDSISRTNDEVTITNGVISSIRTMSITGYGSEVPILQINADINPGNSGGPLMNAKGEVIGVNAYSVSNSSGINGAIAASTVVDFIEQSGLIKRSDNSSLSIPLWLILLLVFLVYCVISGFVIFMITRSKAKIIQVPQSELFKSLPLAEYLRKLDRGLEAGEIASLTYPLAADLKSLHDQGRLFLQLSPRVLMVTNEGIRINPDHVENSRGLPIYMAPEQRSNGPLTAATDIYSFCAVLTYLANYRQAINSQPTSIDSGTAVAPPPLPSMNLNSSKGQANRQQQDNWLQEIIEKGMRFEAVKRYQSFQDILFALTPLNNGLSTELIAPLRNEQPGAIQTKKKTSKFTACAIALGLFVVGLVLYQVGVFLGLNGAVVTDNFKNGQEFLAQMILPEIIAPQQQNYIQAGSLLLDHQYDKAFDAFVALQGSYNSVNMALETKYQQAAWLSDYGKFDEAEEAYKLLGQYKDSSERVKNTEYRKAIYLASTNEFASALAIFQKLAKDGYSNSEEMIEITNYAWGIYEYQNGNYYGAYQKLLLTKGYQDTNALLDQIKISLYNDAIEKYHNEDYNRALSEFSLIEDFEYSKEYMVLARANSLGDMYPAEEILTDLAPLIGFEDASDIIVNDFYFASTYLEGVWSGSDHYFAMMTDVTYSDLPITSGDRLGIEDGTMYTFNHDTPNTKEPAYDIEPVSKDLILLYCYQNSQTYSLVRVATADEVRKYLAEHQ